MTRRAAVLAEIGRCTEYLEHLLSYYDQDNTILYSVAKTIDEIQEVSASGHHDLRFTDLEYCRSWQSSFGSAFMELNGPIYQSIIGSQMFNGAIDYGLQFVSDPTAVREHRIWPFRYLPRPQLRQ